MTSSTTRSRALRALLAVCAVAAWTAVTPRPAPAAAAAPSVSAVPDLTPDRLANDVRFREDFGLDADAAYVRQLYRDARAGRVDASVADGALLTPAEHDDLAARAHAADPVIDAVRAYVRQQPASLYAGMYLDQRHGGRVVVGVTSDPTAHAAAIASRLPAGSAGMLQVVAMPHAMADLEELLSAVDQHEADAEAAGVDVSSIGIDEVGNRVVVGVASDASGATRYFASAFPGAPIQVDEMPHPLLDGVNFTEAGPLRGGQRINYASGTSVHLCTSAFVAYTLNRLDAAIFRYDYFLLTAGHCETDAAMTAQSGTALWQQVDYVIGLSDLNAFVQGSSADAMRIPMRATDTSAEISIAYQLRNLVRCEEAANDDVVGEQEAMSGATTGGAVGGVLKIKKLVVNASDGHGHNVKLVNQKEADYRSRPGDSGGSVYGSRRCAWQAQGIESTGGTRNGRDVSTFTHVSFADAKMGVAILTA